MITKEKLENILTERRNKYGEFTSILDRIYLIKFGIVVSVSNTNKTIESHIEFIKYMLALKAARSIEAKGEYLEDCILDFINYYNLFVSTYKSKITLSDKIFDEHFIKALDIQNKERLSKVDRILKMEIK